MAVAVIGGGVVGLATALALQLKGYEVTVFAEAFTPDTTSDGAAALWRPVFMGGTPAALQARWGEETLQLLRRLAGRFDADAIGVFWQSGFEIFDAAPAAAELPEWRHSVLGFRTLSADEIRTMYPRVPSAKAGWFYTSIMCEGPKYLPFLMRVFAGLGGRCVRRRIESLGEFRSTHDVVVNCVGQAARELCGDQGLVGARGQISLLEAPQVKHFHLHHAADHLTYIIPRARVVVCGGTYEVGDRSELVREEQAVSIVRHADRVVRGLSDAPVQRRWAGVRPMREAGVRLEIECLSVPASGGRTVSVDVVHNYGHGGGGVTVHWGCARDAVKLVEEVLGRKGRLRRASDRRARAGAAGRAAAAAPGVGESEAAIGAQCLRAHL